MTALLLRADVRQGKNRWITHTSELSEEAIVLAADGVNAPLIGSELTVELSFPTLVEPFVVVVRVTGTLPSNGYGQPATVACSIIEAESRARDVLAKLVALTTSPPPGRDHAFARAGNYRCLLVEDNTFICDLFAYGMRKYGRTRGAELELELATDAVNAWSLLSKQRFDIAIIDHFLPLQTGSNLISRMRAEPDLAKILVVAISVGGAEVRQEAMAAGADLFLDKPVVLKDLFSTLDRLTGLEPAA